MKNQTNLDFFRGEIIRKKKKLSQTIKDEFEYAQEYLNKFGNPDMQRLRNRDDITATEEKWKEGSKAAESVNAMQPKEGQMEYEFDFKQDGEKKAEEEEEVDFTKLSPEEKKIYEAKQKEQEVDFTKLSPEEKK